jgi:hypothetical protein
MLPACPRRRFLASFKRTVIVRVLFAALFFCPPLTGCATAGLYKDSAGCAAAAPKHAPSFSYRILRTGIKIYGYKKIYAGDAKTLIARA